MARNDKNITLEDVTIAFRNFAGKESPFNPPGSRNFAIFLEPDLASKMMSDGWNIKHLKARDEGDEPQSFLPVKVSYANRPPKIAIVTSKGITYLGESELEMLDWVDIETADVALNPYEWNVSGKSGIKAYVASLFIKIEEDYLQQKWTAYVEGNRQETRALDAAPDYIDGEYELT